MQRSWDISGRVIRNSAGFHRIWVGIESALPGPRVCAKSLWWLLRLGRAYTVIPAVIGHAGNPQRQGRQISFAGATRKRFARGAHTPTAVGLHVLVAAPGGGYRAGNHVWRRQTGDPHRLVRGLCELRSAMTIGQRARWSSAAGDPASARRIGAVRPQARSMGGRGGGVAPLPHACSPECGTAPTTSLAEWRIGLATSR